MRRQSPEFVPWNSLDVAVLEASASRIGSLKRAEIKHAVLENLKVFPHRHQADAQAFSIAKHALLDIEGAAVIAKFKRHPFRGTEFEGVVGMARFLMVGNEIIPAVLLFGGKSNVLVKHESIHLCQWLNPKATLLNASELLLLVSKDAISAVKPLAAKDPAGAIDLLARITCLKVWTELEAYYWAEGQHGVPPWDIITYAHRSAKPFMTLEEGLATFNLHKHDPLALAICDERLTAFCARMETQVPWVRKLLRAAKARSLYDAMWWRHDEDETEMMSDLL